MTVAAQEREQRRLARKAERQRLKRAAITAGTVALLEARGTDFSVQELADGLGMSQASVFYYFPGGKDELLVEAAWSWFHESHEEVARACRAAATGLDALEALVRVRFDQFMRNPDRHAFVLEAVLRVPLTQTPRAEEFYETVNGVFDIVAGRLAEDQERGLVRADIDPRVRVHSANMQVSGFLMVQHTRIRAHGASKHSMETLCEDLCRQLRDSTAARQG